MHKNTNTVSSRRGCSVKGEKAETLNRTQVLSELHAMLTKMSDKICKGRMRDKQVVDLQLRSLKAFAYACSIYSNVLDSVENEEILRRLDAIEGNHGGSEQTD